MALSIFSEMNMYPFIEPFTIKLLELFQIKISNFNFILGLVFNIQLFNQGFIGLSCLRQNEKCLIRFYFLINISILLTEIDQKIKA